MNWKFIFCWLLSHSFVIAIGANCLRGTHHMWQPKPTPTVGHGAPSSCSRPPSLLLPGNATATEKKVTPPATPTMGILAREDAGTEAAHPAVVLANYVYQCATRRPISTSSSSCNKLPDSESNPELVATSAKASASASGPGSVSASGIQ
ncbi:hypothetical protein KR067_005965 [Drosophila pandora]|nr:hypothetical protein KR067_005965 [Drosophila pandora]